MTPRLLRIVRHSLAITMVAGGLGGGAPVRAAGFSVMEDSHRLVITHAGQSVAEFVFRDDRILRPYFANVHAPGGAKVTRNHPPVEGADATDHATMHPGIWMAFGDVSGADFWRNRGRMEHVRFVESPEVRDGRLRFATECRLVTVDGRELGRVTHRLQWASWEEAWGLDWEAVFRPEAEGLVFGDQEEMGFGGRVATGIIEKNGGSITSSAGKRTAGATWGQGAEWCDYTGRIGDRRVGVTVVADPANFRGSWWHNRDYGLMVANPFGREALKQGPKSAVTVKAGEILRLRFAAVIHSGSSYDPGEAYRRVLAGWGRGGGTPGER